MISISLFLGFHIELNILGTRDISCVLHEIQIWNTNIQTKVTQAPFIELSIYVCWSNIEQGIYKKEKRYVPGISEYISVKQDK